MAACDGADQLQAEQCSLTGLMALVRMKDAKDLVTERCGYDNTVTVQYDPICYVERVTICPECGDIIVRDTAIIWEALFNSVHK